ncbi:MAG: nuclear transport factor 2 family protein [Ferruginibacter sp.]
MNKIELNKQIALNWIDSFNEHDLEKLLNLYNDNAIHFSPKLKIRQPETNGWINGKDSLRSWWADAFDRLPSLQYHLKNLIVNDEQLLMEYQRKVTGEPDMMVAEILEINNGVIVKSRVYHG